MLELTQSTTSTSVGHHSTTQIISGKSVLCFWGNRVTLRCLSSPSPKVMLQLEGVSGMKRSVKGTVGKLIELEAVNKTQNVVQGPAFLYVQ